MAQNTLVPARVRVWLADPGTIAPADATSAMPVGWRNVGNTTPDSLSFTTAPEFDEVPSAQSDYPIRRFQTSDAASLAADLLDWSGQNIRAAFGGGTITEVTPATTPKTYKFVPPRLGERAEQACVIEVIDGTRTYRYVIARVQQVEGVETALNKGATSVLALRLAVLGADGVDAFYILTNDPTFAPAP